MYFYPSFYLIFLPSFFVSTFIFLSYFRFLSSVIFFYFLDICVRECLCLPRQYVLIDSIDKSSSHQAGVDSIVGKVRWHQRLYAVDSDSRCVHCLPDLRLPMSMIYSTPSTFIPVHSTPSTTFINSVCLFTQHRFTPLLPSDHCLVKNSSTTLFTFTVSVTQVDRFITNYLEISDNFILIPFHLLAWYLSSLLQHFISVFHYSTTSSYYHTCDCS